MKKKRSSRSTYLPAFLNSLRTNVIRRYLGNDEIRKGKTLRFSSNKHNSIYDEFNFDFKSTIKRTFDGQTLVKFFYRKLDDFKNELPLDENQDYEDSIIDAFIEYSKFKKEKDGHLFTDLDSSKLNGCYLINFNFMQEVSTKNHSYEDFYLAKEYDYCQWYGVIKNWDFKHELNYVLKHEIKECFKSDSSIVAVIFGPGGSGKSTLLRNLAISCIGENYAILWINDLDFFIANQLNDLITQTKKYLLIIEDWTSVEQDQSLAYKFLNRIVNQNHIKLIIGDRTVSSKNYKKYVYSNNLFELTADDNQMIINRVLNFVPGWKPAQTELPFNEIYNAPIFIILFVLARETELDEVQYTKDVTGRFKDILENDLKKLSYYNFGFAKAFYYLAFLFGDQMQTFKWSLLISLAKYFDAGNEIRELENFNLLNPCCKILSNYIFLENLVIPNYEQDQIIYFHHKILSSEGFCKLSLDNFYFDVDIIPSVVDFFNKDEEFAISHDLLKIYSFKKKNLSDNFINSINEFINSTPSFSGRLSHNYFLEKLYQQADNLMNESKWKNKLFYIFIFFRNYPNDCIQIILLNLIKRGCKAKCIKDAYDKSISDEGFLLNTLMPEIFIEISNKYKGTKNEIDVIYATKMNWIRLDDFQDSRPYLIYNIDEIDDL